MYFEQAVRNGRKTTLHYFGSETVPGSESVGCKLGHTYPTFALSRFRDIPTFFDCLSV